MWGMHEDKPTTGYEGSKTILEKCQMDKNMKKELWRFKEGSEAEIHLELLREILKRVPNWKTLGHNGFCYIQVCGCKKNKTVKKI